MERKADNKNDITITGYNIRYEQDLLRMLLLLQHTYFQENASVQNRELRAEKDVEGAYKTYLNEVQEDTDNNWNIFLALAGNKAVGFIIGSIEKDGQLVKGNIGKIEDWYVEHEYRGMGIGMKLYNGLEKWFVEKGCDQVVSDTWEGNDLSIKAHKQSGFFVSGIMFSKKLK